MADMGYTSMQVSNVFEDKPAEQVVRASALVWVLFKIPWTLAGLTNQRVQVRSFYNAHIS
jgi:hypothetical protein